MPVKYVGYSPCFRREAGTYGKDTKGILRVHQFAKVEQYIICRADHGESVRWHEELLANSEEIVQALELPYRVLNICTGDLGDAKVKGYDIECWMPSEGRYRETHSDSYFHDYQARRANIRYRDDDGTVRFVHTLNNTALASTRTIIDAGREPPAGGWDGACAGGAAPLPRRARDARASHPVVATKWAARSQGWPDAAPGSPERAGHSQRAPSSLCPCLQRTPSRNRGNSSNSTNVQAATSTVTARQHCAQQAKPAPEWRRGVPLHGRNDEWRGAENHHGGPDGGKGTAEGIGLIPPPDSEGGAILGNELASIERRTGISDSRSGVSA